MTVNPKTNAIQMVDKAIGDISGRQLVSSSDMTDLLLDIRLYLLLTEEITPTHES